MSRDCCKNKRGYKFHYEELWSTKDMIQYNSAASQKESKTENQEIAEAAISLCCYLGNAFCQKKKKKRMKTKIESKEAIVQTKFHVAPQPISKLTDAVSFSDHYHKDLRTLHSNT